MRWKLFSLSHTKLSQLICKENVWKLEGRINCQIFGVEGVKFSVIGFDCILEKRVEFILME